MGWFSWSKDMDKYWNTSIIVSNHLNFCKILKRWMRSSIVRSVNVFFNNNKQEEKKQQQQRTSFIFGNDELNLNKNVVTKSNIKIFDELLRLRNGRRRFIKLSHVNDAHNQFYLNWLKFLCEFIVPLKEIKTNEFKAQFIIHKSFSVK